MSITGDEQIQRIVLALQKGMLGYIDGDDDARYGPEAVAKCLEIVRSHLAAIERTADPERAAALVKSTVLALNDLNEECGGALIETDQREDLCAILTRAGSMKGFNGPEEDVTEKWREW